MTDQDLAQLSNTAIYSAMVVLTLAMLAYAVYLARLAPSRGDEAGVDAVDAHDYFIEDTYEAGLSLMGTEVKSLRMGRASLVDGFAVFYGMRLANCASLSMG